jgi:hypothetical protein
MIRKTISLAILISLFYACTPPARINIKGRYFLESDDYGKYIVGYQVDEHENFQILVDVYVFAAGFNDKFIIAIQHPKEFHGMSTDSNYYIVPFHSAYTYSPQDGIIGPLTPKEFNMKKSELKIDHLIWREFN